MGHQNSCFTFQPKSLSRFIGRIGKSSVGSGLTKLERYLVISHQSVPLAGLESLFVQPTVHGLHINVCFSLKKQVLQAPEQKEIQE